MKLKQALALIVITLFSNAAAQAVTIDWVTVGNPGNAPDTRYDATGFGAVPHTYRISKFEITAGQYTEFLNAVAKADPNGLYNTSMGSIPNIGANIIRSGSAPNFSYSVASDWANRPVNYVSFWDAARFVNWLHNDQPTGPQGLGTTEAGAYINIGNQATFARQSGAKYWIPTENEWYKAAYYDPNHGGPGAGGYWEYPTGTNALPGLDLTETTNPGNNANYYNNGSVIGDPYYRTEVGEFKLSASPYGTFDQGGNVGEWNETVVFSSWRGARGGSFNLDSFFLRASTRHNADPALEDHYVGFRVASIPEPSAICLAALGLAASLMSRRARPIQPPLHKS